ncbi:MAG: DUF4340 domain-containing protein, partial [Rhodospirillales bacterium]|nr:DUF4340 domain-containing protein [Rhodospirillales bacterium]
MSAKLVMVGAIVTLVTVIAAAVSVINQPGLTKAEVSGEPAFSALRQSPDAVARVTIAGKDGEFSVARNDAGLWVIPEKHGYPVAFAKVRELVATMAGMDLIEGMTANPDRFARLEVEDLDKEAAESRRVRLETADGSVLAETIVGKRRHGFTGGRETGTYIRRDGDERAWLASGGLVVNVKPEEWLDRGVVDISADSIQTMTFDPLEGKGY